MKPIHFFGAAIIALALSACGKKGSSSSSAALGTFTFTTNSKVYTWPAVCDTGGFFSITATGLYPGTTDTAQIYLIMSQTGANRYAAKANGAFPDTGYYNGDLLYPTLWHNGDDYRNYNPNNVNGPETHSCIINITSNNGSVMSGTFSGMLYDEKSGADSILMTNGAWSVKLQQ